MQRGRLYAEVGDKDFYHGIVVQDKHPITRAEISQVGEFHRSTVYAKLDNPKDWPSIVGEGTLTAFPRGKSGYLPIWTPQFRPFRAGDAWIHPSDPHQQLDPLDTPHVLELRNFLSGHPSPDGRRQEPYSAFIMKGEDDWFWVAIRKQTRTDYGHMYRWRFYRCDEVAGLIECLRAARPW